MSKTLQIKLDIDRFPKGINEQKGWPFNDNLSPVKFAPDFKWPKISIVTPSFNQGKYIEQTILSVLGQQYPNLEYIIIDGGSTDETLSIIKKYESQITYWVSERDNGQSHAINKGLLRCTGEIFNWLNSDDWYTPNSFYQIAHAFLDNPDAQVISGFEEHHAIDGSRSLHQGSFVADSLNETIEFCELAQPSTFFKLAAMRQIGGVSEDLHYIMDGEMWVKYLLWYGQGGFKKIEHTLVNFRLHENSKTISNQEVNNFLIERSSIIVDLQRFVGVPEKMVLYYIDVIYKTPMLKELKRNWEINPEFISKREIRGYFMNKYIIKQFRRGNTNDVKWGIKELLKNGKNGKKTGHLRC